MDPNISRANDRKRIFDIWQKARDGNDLTGEEKNQAESLLLHREFYPFWNRLPYLVNADFTVNGVNPVLHITLHTIVENQVTVNYDPEVEKALKNHLSAGYTRHEAIHQIMEVLAEELGNSLIGGVGFNNKSYHNKLKLMLSREKKDVKLGRNEPCICGSGKKYKRCCEGNELVQIRQGEGFERKGRLLLGAMKYAAPDYLMYCDEDDQVLYLENKIAVILALEEFGDIEGAELAFEDLLKDAEGTGKNTYVKNTLRSFLMFCLNNKSSSEKGFKICKRLYDMEDSPEEKADCLINTADLYCNLSDYENAEKVYNDLINDYPEYGWGLLAYARYLANKGEIAEAEKIYRRVIAQNEEFHDTVICAEEELRDLLKQK